MNSGYHGMRFRRIFITIDRRSNEEKITQTHNFLPIRWSGIDLHGGKGNVSALN